MAMKMKTGKAVKKHVAEGIKAATEDGFYRYSLQIEKKLMFAFLAKCKREGSSASAVIRQFVKDEAGND